MVINVVRGYQNANGNRSGGLSGIKDRTMENDDKFYHCQLKIFVLIHRVVENV